MSAAGPSQDVIVGWLQNDYGKLGRPAEAIAQGLRRSQLARRVAVVTPQTRTRRPFRYRRLDDRGVEVHRLYSRWTLPPSVFRFLLTSRRRADATVLLNCGVGEANALFHTAFRSRVARRILVVHDVLDLWPGMAPAQAERLRGIRAQLLAESDLVIGLSEGAIADVPGAVYVGHGCDDVWTDPSVDHVPEPVDLAPIPHPRALYYGTLRVRIQTASFAALADRGVQVVLVGLQPNDEVRALIDNHPNVHFLGERTPAESAGYLLHCDIGIVPHTDEPFTRSMEPHKLYNYACAGLRSVAGNCVVPRHLEQWVTSASTPDEFAAASMAAITAGRLSADAVDTARSFTWDRVATAIAEHAGLTSR